jgi:hypothetical protein
MRKKSGLVLGLKRAFFIGCFEKTCWLDVVFCVAKRGEMRG